MSKIYSFLTMLLCIAMLPSCDNTEGITEEVSHDAIAFSATTKNSSSIQPLAAGDFPNDGKIGVIAASYKTSDIDWTSYPDIDNAIAKAAGSGTYTFAWEKIKYWPFDNSQLAFIAYSPAAKTSGAVILNSDKTSLSLTLENNMPDVLYASANSTLTPYSKSMNTVVDLGEFKHALSQLTVKVKGDAAADVDLISLEILTPKKKATLNLLNGDSGLTMGVDDIFIQKLVTGNQNIIDKVFENTMLLYPGTEDVTQLKIVLKERGIAQLVYSFAYSIPQFENTSNPSKPISFERGKNTTLTIDVKGKQITAASLLLEASILDWIPKGDFGVIIK